MRAVLKIRQIQRDRFGGAIILEAHAHRIVLATEFGQPQRITIRLENEVLAFISRPATRQFPTIGRRNAGGEKDGH